MIDDKLKTLKIIAGSLMFSGLIYSGCLFIISGEPREVSVGISLSMFAAAMGSMAGAIVIRHVLMGSFALLPRQHRETTSPLSPDETREAVQNAVGRYMTGTIVSMALAESVILFGFVLAYLTAEPLRIVPFLLAGELLMLVVFPRRSILETLLSPAAQAGLTALELEGGRLDAR